MAHWFRTYSDILNEFDSSNYGGKPLKKFTFIYGSQLHDIMADTPASAMDKANKEFNAQDGYWQGNSDSPNLPVNTYKWKHDPASGSLFN